MNQLAIKPIETRYKGCRFRSRLEARWAVFFDTLGIKWEYELEGFELPDGRRYLPDFYLPVSKTWVEVKGSDEQMDWELVYDVVRNAILPHTKKSIYTTSGLLILGPIPDPNIRWCHRILHNNSSPDYDCDSVDTSYVEFYDSSFFGGCGIILLPFIPVDYDPQYDKPLGINAFPTKRLDSDLIHMELNKYGIPKLFGLEFSSYVFSRAVCGYTAARSARFEFGEEG